MLSIRLRKSIAVAAIATISFASIAAPVAFNYTQQFSGDPMAGTGATSPWATASFLDIAVNTVRLTLSATGLAPNQRMEAFYFNLASLSPTSLSFSQSSGPTATIGRATNDFKADGDGYYDVRLSFDTRLNLAGNPNPNVFTSTRSAVFTITGSGVNSSSFTALSSPTNSHGVGGSGHGPFYSAAHVILATSGQSAWVNSASPTPEPETLALMLLGFAMTGYIVRRRRQSQVRTA